MAGPVVLSEEKKAAVLMRYQQSLEDLTFNSKPIIDDLTREAGIRQAMGDKIVDVIHSRIMKVAVKQAPAALWWWTYHVLDSHFCVSA